MLSEELFSDAYSVSELGLALKTVKISV